MDNVYISKTGYYGVLLNEIIFIQVGRFDNEVKDTLIANMRGKLVRIYSTKNKIKMDAEYHGLLTAWLIYHQGRSLNQTIDLVAKKMVEEMQEEDDSESDNKNSAIE